MMISVNLLGEQITGAISGKPYSVAFDAEKYKGMKELETKANAAQSMDELKTIVAEFEAFTKENFKEIVETKHPELFVNKSSGKYFLQSNGVLSTIPIPQVLVDKILMSVEKGIDATPLIKFWIRTLRNPKMRENPKKRELLAKYISAPYTDYTVVTELEKKEGLSNEQAVLRATTSQVSITVEGLLVGYKVSKEITTKFMLDENENKVVKGRYKADIDEDTGLVTYNKPEFAEDLLFEPAVQGQSGDEFHCIGSTSAGIPYAKKGHHIRVGAIHKLDNWDQVNCDDSATCVRGLHIGGLFYIKGYQKVGTVTHNVFIDPKHIGAKHITRRAI